MITNIYIPIYIPRGRLLENSPANAAYQTCPINWESLFPIFIKQMVEQRLAGWVGGY